MGEKYVYIKKVVRGGDVYACNCAEYGTLTL
jgi:hypothetical protein